MGILEQESRPACVMDDRVLATCESQLHDQARIVLVGVLAIERVVNSSQSATGPRTIAWFFRASQQVLDAGTLQLQRSRNTSYTKLGACDDGWRCERHDV